jgi:hypothetical protein
MKPFNNFFVLGLAKSDTFLLSTTAALLVSLNTPLIYKTGGASFINFNFSG